MSSIESAAEHEHRPAPGAVVDARSGYRHVSTCTCGVRIVAVTPGRMYGEWRILIDEPTP